MNHFIVSILGVINGLVFIAIIIVIFNIGGQLGYGDFGIVVGIALATFVCGMLAIAISIEESLRTIANAHRPQSSSSSPRASDGFLKGLL